MSDFYKIVALNKNKKEIHVLPRFSTYSTDNIMIRGNDFYAVYDRDSGLWSKDQDVAIRMIDEDIRKETQNVKENFPDSIVVSELMGNDAFNSMKRFKSIVKKMLKDSYHTLDSRIVQKSESTELKDYATKKLPYDIKEGSIDAYEELIGTLYSEEEKTKIEWAIGAILNGDVKKIQKFIVLYGDAGSGKSTLINIIKMLFEGYYSSFDAKDLGVKDNAFALEPFKNNPLVSIDSEGDLSRIEDNTRLNAIVSHDELVVNEKHKSLYSATFNTFIFIATNRPVKITEAKSGLTRRLIDVQPTGKLVPYSRYKVLMEQIKFELGAIAYHCLDKYKSMGEDYYESYKPNEMMSATNHFYAFMEDNYDFFINEDPTELKTIWRLYKEYIQDALIKYPMNMQTVKEEAKNYFTDWRDRGQNSNGQRARNIYYGFRKEKFNYDFKATDNSMTYSWLEFNGKRNIFDEMCAECPAQPASSMETPMKPWDKVKTKLKDIDVKELHYVRVPDNHIVIDFDIKDENGEKSFELNRVAATKFPKTYAELSKSGAGIHLHYIYEGDVEELSRIFDDEVEVKVFTGKSSLRRKETGFNELPIATINSGLPLKGAKKMVNYEGFKDQQHLINFIKNCLMKKHHGHTTPEVQFIKDKLDEAYASGMSYDVSAMKQDIIDFADRSTHQAALCNKLVSQMKFISEDQKENVEDKERPLVFYDVEVFPNLFVVVFKALGGAPVKLINPTAKDLEPWVRTNLVGFNCRRYDNHIIYARLLGFSNLELYDLSQRIISGNKNAFFSEAYGLSYTDIYDFSSKKQSLKKWEIALGIHHHELGMKWDEPVPEDKWEEVAKYCVDDVIATEAVWNARQADFVAREILADIAGMTVNDTTNSLTTRIIFGKERNPKLVYTDLSTGKSSDGTYLEMNKFDGYKYADGHNIFMGEDVGKGGYVYSEPGMYGNVALLDIASMHPNSIINMNCFGDYTKNFKDILDARIAIKHGDFETARIMLNGALAPYLDDESKAKDLAQALKIAINSVYGLTSASFNNPFKDERNKNNIVALRGALFMVLLKYEVQKRGYTVAHIKTDSIKIPDADMDIINFVMKFGKKYGYNFEHEATYDRMCLVNDAVYIARYSTPAVCKELYGYIPDDCTKHPNEWTATGAQFAVPYVFKTLFSKEKIEFKDMCETKTVTTALYLDMNENLGEDEHSYYFVGKAGLFTPIKAGCGGGLLVREKEGKYNAAPGTKGYRWLESEMVEQLNKQKDIDKSYYDELANKAIEAISKYGDYEWFVSEEMYKGELKGVNK